MKEKWLPIPGFKYEVSNFGRIKNSITGRILSKAIDNSGYEFVGLWDGKKTHSKRVHRLVALLFIGSSKKEFIAHLDGNKTNNMVENLIYVDTLPTIQHRNNRLINDNKKKGQLLREGQIKRFIVNDLTDCWEWQGPKSQGYGVMKRHGVTMYAHRFFYEYYIGPIEDNLFVCHKCDNPSCVNPDHLFLGTQKDNMQDKYNKGRNAPLPSITHPEKIVRGEKHWKSKLKDKDIYDIRDSSLSSSELAKVYGITSGYVTKIKIRKAWRHI